MNVLNSFSQYQNTANKKDSTFFNELNISSDDKVLMEKIELLIKSQNKIEAIKLLVSAKKTRLIDAKNMVEAIEVKLKNQI